MTTLPEVRVGDPIRHEALTVFPLFSPPDGAVDYLLSDEAIGAGSVTVEEVSEGGSVPNLLVSNTGDSRVLFLEGEELQGGQAEPGAEHLGAGRRPQQDADPGQLRRAGPLAIPDEALLLGRVALVLQAAAAPQGVGRPVAQGRPGAHVRPGGRLGGGQPPDGLPRVHRPRRRRCPTPTSSYQDRLDEFRERLKYVEGASGVAVAVGPQVVAVDVFDKPSTCRKVWDRLLSGVVMDALEAGQPEKVAEAADVEGLLARLRDAAWEPAPAVGEGQEYRSDAVPSAHASSLVLGDSVLHGSVVVAS